MHEKSKTHPQHTKEFLCSMLETMIIPIGNDQMTIRNS